MPLASVSASQSAGATLWAQLQQQQAQRNADQAEQRANVLQSQAKAAQSDADKAQERARNLQVESNAAQSTAGEARRNLVELDSLQQVKSQFSEVRQQISNVLQSDSPTAKTTTQTPVVNGFGQETGKLVNVVA